MTSKEELFAVVKKLRKALGITHMTAEEMFKIYMDIWRVKYLNERGLIHAR